MVAGGTQFSDFTPLAASAGPTADESTLITFGNPIFRQQSIADRATQLAAGIPNSGNWDMNTLNETGWQRGRYLFTVFETGPAGVQRHDLKLHVDVRPVIMQLGGCVMAVVPLTRIDREIEIEAPPERVWRALTDAADLAAWFQVKIEGVIAVGNEVWMTSVHPEHAGLRFPVRIVELTPPRRVVWQWHPGDIDAAIDYSSEPPTTVTFTLEPAGQGTRVSVSETGFDQIALARRATAYADNSQGWTEVLGWLQKYVEAAR